MKITRENYELFLVDYMDGNLSEQSRQELQSFLDVNPELNDEFADLEKIKLEGEPLDFQDKDLVLMNEHGYPEVEHLLVAEREGDLSADESQRLRQLKENSPALEKDTALYKKIVFKPNLATQYPDKTKVTKSVLRPRFWSYAAAASILLGLFIGFGLNGSEGDKQFSDANEPEFIEAQPAMEVENLATSATVQPAVADSAKQMPDSVSATHQLTKLPMLDSAETNDKEKQADKHTDTSVNQPLQQP